MRTFPSTRFGAFTFGFAAALGFVLALILAGFAWRVEPAAQFTYGIICQGLNAIYYGTN